MPAFRDLVGCLQHLIRDLLVDPGHTRLIATSQNQDRRGADARAEWTGGDHPQRPVELRLRMDGVRQRLEHRIHEVAIPGGHADLGKGSVGSVDLGRFRTKWGVDRVEFESAGDHLIGGADPDEALVGIEIDFGRDGDQWVPDRRRVVGQTRRPMEKPETEDELQRLALLV